MSAPIILRDEKIVLALTTEPEGEMECERCSMSLMRPAQHGYPRKVNNARAEYIELPGHGGKKLVANIALLCGECKDAFLLARPYWVFLPKQYQAWLDAYVGIAVTPEEDLAEATSITWEGAESTKGAKPNRAKSRPMPPQTMTRAEFVTGEKAFTPEDRGEDKKEL
jgi:hypothetical protein